MRLLSPFTIQHQLSITQQQIYVKLLFTYFNINFICMAFVKQICDGYSKHALMGNWAEERLYPAQPFRQNIDKQPRRHDQAITTLDGKGFQRALPKLERRTKWETAQRIILNDGVPKAPTVMRAQYPHYEQQSSYAQMKRPFDKTSSHVYSTSVHPYSENKPVQVNYHIINKSNTSELLNLNQRDVKMYTSDFKSTLPQHPAVEKYTNYTTQYRGKYQGQNQSLRSRTMSQFNQTRTPAGSFTQVYPEQTVKPITTMFCQNKKDFGDEKEVTSVQRSWVPQRDKAISYSMGRTAEQFKKKGIVSNDIQTNLNINIGVHNLHPKEIPVNYFKHNRNITNIYNNSLCSRP